MKQEDYQKLSDDVFGLIDTDTLLKALEPTKPSERVDGVQDIIRTAIIESSIGKYKGAPYFFNGKMYKRMSYDEFGNLIYDLMKRSGLKVGDFAKILRQNGIDIGQNRLFAWLRVKGFLCKSGERYNQPTQRAMEMGLFEVKKTTINKPDGSILVSTTTKVTGKGQVYFVNDFLRD